MSVTIPVSHLQVRLKLLRTKVVKYYYIILLLERKRSEKGEMDVCVNGKKIRCIKLKVV